MIEQHTGSASLAQLASAAVALGLVCAVLDRVFRVGILTPGIWLLVCFWLAALAGVLIQDFAAEKTIKPDVARTFVGFETVAITTIWIPATVFAYVLWNKLFKMTFKART